MKGAKILVHTDHEVLWHLDTCESPKLTRYALLIAEVAPETGTSTGWIIQFCRFPIEAPHCCGRWNENLRLVLLSRGRCRGSIHCRIGCIGPRKIPSFFVRVVRDITNTLHVEERTRGKLSRRDERMTWTFPLAILDETRVFRKTCVTWP